MIKIVLVFEIFLFVCDFVKVFRKLLKKLNGGLVELCDEFVKELDDVFVGAVKMFLVYYIKMVEVIKMFNFMYEEDGY